MLSKWIYILIGNNNTGKTTFQKRLIYHLTGHVYVRLDRNVDFEITHKYAPKKLKDISLISRSFQESRDDYESVKNYFDSHFKEKDVCILSSHAQRANIAEIKEMIEEGRRRKYNLGGVFWSNCDTDITAEISLLDWNERFNLYNPECASEESWKEQIDNLAWEFSEMLIRRAMIQ